MKHLYSYLSCIVILLLLGGDLGFSKVPEKTKTPKDRNSEHSISIGFMQTQIYNEYVSYLPYKGPQFGLLYDANREMRISKTKQEWSIQAEAGPLMAPAKNRTNISTRLHAHWGMYNEVFSIKGFSINVGGQLQSDSRIAYFPAYGNSLIQVASNINLAFTAKFGYNFKIKNFPMRLHYNLAIPVVGLGFAPDFGASYYEMLGLDGGFNNVLSCFSLHNYANLQNEFGLDFVLNRCTLRLSYVGYSLWSRNKQIYNEWHSHGVQLGFVINMQNKSGRNEK